MQRSPHLIVWDDATSSAQLIDGAELMQRLGRVLDADYKEKQFRGEPRYELHRSYPAGVELSVIAGHIVDDREVLSLVIDLRQLGSARPLLTCHLSGGVQRVKASKDTAWLRARNGTVVIVGEGLGGIVEVQN